jgi:hypothetical protein
MIFFEFDPGFIPESNVSVRDTKVGKILVKVINVEKVVVVGKGFNLKIW